MTSRLRREWRFRDGVILMTLVALAVVATRDIWALIFEIAWRDEENSYILLAPLIAAWLFWIRRDRLRFGSPHWTPTGPIVIGLGWAMIAVGYAKGFDIGEHLGALLVVFGAGLTVFGWKFVRSFLPAFVGLLFLLPTPGTIRSFIAIPLEAHSASITHSILETFGVPIFLEGNLLSINGHDVAVAEACNGMRMVSALALVTYAFVFSVPMRQSVRIGFLVFSPLVALFVNIIRLVPTVLFYGYTKQSTAELFHDVSGWAMLGVALVILWGFRMLLRWLEIPIVPYSSGQPEYAR